MIASLNFPRWIRPVAWATRSQFSRRNILEKENGTRAIITLIVSSLGTVFITLPAITYASPTPRTSAGCVQTELETSFSSSCCPENFSLGEIHFESLVPFFLKLEKQRDKTRGNKPVLQQRRGETGDMGIPPSVNITT
jgi:hypothetical protein